MAQLNNKENLTKKLLIDTQESPKIQVDLTNVMTGDRYENRYLYYQLKMSMKAAKSVDIIVSFLMESGVKLILEDLQMASQRGVHIRMLTGNYLGITQPQALYMLKKELHENVDLRFYNDKSRSFHPKAYIFHYENDSEIFIGSSNISRSALTSGIEWNYRFKKSFDVDNFSKFNNTFMDLFDNHSIVIDDLELKRYSKSWKKPAVIRDLARYDEAELEVDLGSNINFDKDKFFVPRGAQIEALYALKDTREQGATKALIEAATGIGKTYLAAFDSLLYKRVLFLAHREEILNQAAIAFRNVRESSDFGFFDGNSKENKAAVIFASVFSLGKEEFLNKEYFEKDYFDYIVVDEFHHAITKQYQRIIDYFKPKFLLGLTATPERMDGKNIYEICDYNVPYRIDLKEAINKGMLVPFHYYGIYDETDYNNIHLVKGVYDEHELNQMYIGNIKRYELIYKHYKKYRSKRAMGFCCSREHAHDMAREFNKRGVSAAAVYSNAEGEFAKDRQEAIKQLIDGDIKVIFCVDMFNEGLDIPSIDMVMFLRPTQSPVIYLQQLGRGLRTYKNKEYLNVLDFIGNYNNASKVPYIFSSKNNSLDIAKNVDQNIQDIEYPDDCIVDFDMRLIDLFEELNKKRLGIKEIIRKEYYKVKELISLDSKKVPTRVELFTYMDTDIYDYCKKNASNNPFRDYLSFLNEIGELEDDELLIYNSLGRDFLNVLETTNMTKVYKMPILLSFYNKDSIKLQVTKEEVLISWKEFFDNNINWKDFDKNIDYEKYKSLSDNYHLSKITSMPVKYLKESGKGFFVDKSSYLLAIRHELAPLTSKPSFINHYKDIIDFRTLEYFHKRYRD